MARPNGHDIRAALQQDGKYRTQPELVYPDWSASQYISDLNPDLIVIHFSAFASEEPSNERVGINAMTSLLYALKEKPTRFLVYSRQWSTKAEGEEALERAIPLAHELRDRVYVLALDGVRPATFRSGAALQCLKAAVQDILEHRAAGVAWWSECKST